MARTRNTRGNPKTTLKINQGNQNKNDDKCGGIDLGKIDQLVQHAEQLLISSEYDQAKRICQQVLELQNDHIKALETLALCELELGEINSARKLFSKCLNHSKPNPEPTVHLYLAQLSCSPKEALSHYKKALDLLKCKLNQILQAKNAKKVQDDDQSIGTDSANQSSLATPTLEKKDSGSTVHWSIDESQIRRSCSRALVAMTEIYLTDLCFEASAEEKCLEYLAMASSIDPTDPEPLQTLASVRISQSERELAKEALILSWSLWRDKISIRKPKTNGSEKKMDLHHDQMSNMDLREEDGMDDEKKEEEADRTMDSIDSKMIIEEEVMIEEEQEDQTDQNVLPPVESRINWAKLAIECDMWNSAIEVLQQCEAEDDEDGEIQYLLAVSWFLLGQSRPPNSDSNQVDPQPNNRVSDYSVAAGDGLGRTECWLEVQESIETCLQLHERLGESSGIDKSILQHLKEIKEELDQAGLAPIQIEDDQKAELDENQIEDDDWVDASDIEMA